MSNLSWFYWASFFILLYFIVLILICNFFSFNSVMKKFKLTKYSFLSIL